MPGFVFSVGISPALAAGTLLAFTLAIEEFGVPAALGSRAGVGMLTVGIEKKLADWPVDLPGAALLSLLLMAVATSIDALAMGITFAFLSVSIGKASGLIGCTTFVISALGVFIGNRFGAKYKDKASLTGGIILILIGCKVLLEHLGILG